MKLENEGQKRIYGEEEEFEEEKWKNNERLDLEERRMRWILEKINKEEERKEIELKVHTERLR